jgi:hypothetical protein
MRSLRSSIIALMIHLAIFFNIERLDFGRTEIIDVIDIKAYVYVLALIAVITIITVRRFWRGSLIINFVIWLGIFAVLKSAMNPDRSLILGGVYLYLTMTEAALLAITVALAHNLANHLYDTEETINNITFVDEPEHVRLMEDAENEIQKEIYRSRRYQYPITVIVIELDEENIQPALNRTLLEVQKNMMKQYVLMSLARSVHKGLRLTDLLLEQRSHRRLVLFSPYTDFRGADLLAQRIRNVAQDRFGVYAEVGIATFPDDAITVDDLIRSAETRLSENKKGEPVDKKEESGKED